MDYKIKYPLSEISQNYKDLVNNMNTESYPLTDQFWLQIQKQIKILSNSLGDDFTLHQSDDTYMLEINQNNNNPRAVIIHDPGYEPVHNDIILQLLRNYKLIKKISLFIIIPPPDDTYVKPAKNISLPEFLREETLLSPDEIILNNFPINYKDWQQPMDAPTYDKCSSITECKYNCKTLMSCKKTRVAAPPNKIANSIARLIYNIKPELIIALEKSLLSGVSISERLWEPSALLKLQEYWNEVEDILPLEIWNRFNKLGNIRTISARDVMAGETIKGTSFVPLIWRSLDSKFNNWHKKHTLYSGNKFYSGNVLMEDFIESFIPQTQVLRINTPYYNYEGMKDYPIPHIQKKINRRVINDKIITEVNIKYLSKEQKEVINITNENTKNISEGEDLIELDEKMLATYEGKYLLLLHKELSNIINNLKPYVNDIQNNYELSVAMKLSKQIILETIKGNIATLSDEKPRRSNSLNFFHYQYRIQFPVLQAAMILEKFIEQLNTEDKIILETLEKTKEIINILSKRYETDKLKLASRKELKQFISKSIALHLSLLETGAMAADITEGLAIDAAFKSHQLNREAKKSKYLPKITNRQRKELEEAAFLAKEESDRLQYSLNEKRASLGLESLQLSYGDPTGDIGILFVPKGYEKKTAKLAVREKTPEETSVLVFEMRKRPR